jgi:hypothetical protein
MSEKLIWSYGCVRCQKHHYEGDALYVAHHGWQDKHGSKQVPVSYSLIGKLPVEFDGSGRLKLQAQ